MDVRSVMSASPWVEVGIRKLYWGSPVLPSINGRLDELRKKRAKGKKRASPSTSIGQIVDQLRSWGLGAGDLIVLHSGYRGIRAGGSSPDDVLDALLEFVGPDGTLATPAIPYWPEAPQGYEFMTADVSGLVLDYDPATTPAWTGAVPNAMLKRAEARRSSHPLNSMVAIGPMAEAMMEDNLAGDRAFANGPTSSWNFCNENGAKVVAMGADMAHSLTMIHLAEDLMGEDWPVIDWYRDRTFRILVGGEWQEHGVRERCPRWSHHYGERTLSKDLRRTGICKHATLDGVNLELLSSPVMIDYLNSRNSTLYPYFMIPPWRRKGGARNG